MENISLETQEKVKNTKLQNIFNKIVQFQLSIIMYIFTTVTMTLMLYIACKSSLTMLFS